MLEEGAQAHGWETDLWTSKRVAALIEREFEIAFTRRHCSRILRELGYRPVRPRAEAAENRLLENHRMFGVYRVHHTECRRLVDDDGVVVALLPRFSGG
ncbi:hypothetical protein BRC93_11135 [Halobacteriales archaeon QS_5_70_15]|nr:MAG: hypothetical protein BRC93_11135 [Halobacteriales archaeon QS_5_70_15]